MPMNRDAIPTVLRCAVTSRELPASPQQDDQPLDVERLREGFPALQERFDGAPAVFLDGPGGTQAHASVITAMTDYFVRRNSNTHGCFATSERTDAVIDAARRAGADLLGCDPDEVVFGANMTSLTMALSRSLGASALGPGDEIVVTRLDHDANVAPWLLVAEDIGARVRWIELDPRDCTLDLESARRAITPRTKIVALGYASNLSGTVNDLELLTRWAHDVGALVYVDAVQLAPHRLIDVRALDCDFLVCSAYKFFGPHVGMLYGRRALLQPELRSREGAAPRLRAYAVRPADQRWETGTQNHEGLAGATAAIDYLASLGGHGDAAPRRARLARAFQRIAAHERRLVDALLDGLADIPGARVYGITEPAGRDRRVATVSLRIGALAPSTMARALAEHNIFCWDGDFFAVEPTRALGFADDGGFLRIGAVHYNTVAEVERCVGVIAALARRESA